MATSLDIKKRLAALYRPSAKVPSVVGVPPLRFLMIDGVGAPGDADFQLAMSALYGLAYPVKFSAKRRLGIAYPVMPSEGLYWDAEGGPLQPPSSPATTAWRLMILLPDEVPGEFVDEVRGSVARKKAVARLDDVRVQTFSEGTSVQILHVGPYSDEPPTVRRLLEFAADRGLEVTGAHHEIYLGDPNRSAPEKLKTVIRYPVRRA